MHLIQSLKNEFCFDLPLFSKYPATSINSYFNKMTLVGVENRDNNGIGDGWKDHISNPYYILEYV